MTFTTSIVYILAKFRFCGFRVIAGTDWTPITIPDGLGSRAPLVTTSETLNLNISSIVVIDTKNTTIILMNLLAKLSFNFSFTLTPVVVCTNWAPLVGVKNVMWLEFKW